jgi:hypothetical protein
MQSSTIAAAVTTEAPNRRDAHTTMARAIQGRICALHADNLFLDLLSQATADSERVAECAE